MVLFFKYTILNGPKCKNGPKYFLTLNAPYNWKVLITNEKKNFSDIDSLIQDRTER